MRGNINKYLHALYHTDFSVVKNDINNCLSNTVIHYVTADSTLCHKNNRVKESSVFCTQR